MSGDYDVTVGRSWIKQPLLSDAASSYVTFPWSKFRRQSFPANIRRAALWDRQETRSAFAEATPRPQLRD